MKCFCICTVFIIWDVHYMPVCMLMCASDQLSGEADNSHKCCPWFGELVNSTAEKLLTGNSTLWPTNYRCHQLLALLHRREIKRPLVCSSKRCLFFHEQRKTTWEYNLSFSATAWHMVQQQKPEAQYLQNQRVCGGLQCFKHGCRCQEDLNIEKWLFPPHMFIPAAQKIFDLLNCDCSDLGFRLLIIKWVHPS